MITVFVYVFQALANRGAPDANVVGSDIPVKSLPHCKKTNCNGLLRPHIVWFGESLESAVLEKAGKYIFIFNGYLFYLFYSFALLFIIILNIA